VLLPGTAMVAHIGDSRVYRVRGSTLEQLTFDHSLVWEMAAASHVSADKVPACIPKNVITRSLGPHETVNIDLEGPAAVDAGDVFVLCSDGLSGVVDDAVIGALAAALEPTEAAETLIDLANLRGGPDNISVIIARVEEPDTPDEPAAQEPTGGLGRVHALAWMAMVACLAAVFAFGAYQNGLGALLAAAGFGASLVIAIIQHSTPAAVALPATLGGPYGNGPYRRYDCKQGAAAAATLMAVVDELADIDGDPLPNDLPDKGAAQPRAAAGLDWAPFHEQRAAAKSARDRGDHAASLRSSSDAIRTLMRQVRAQQSEGAAGR
ncbi:MAG: hypothetical protein AAGG46_08040, partial [Planctomycetota bacterium]